MKSFIDLLHEDTDFITGEIIETGQKMAKGHPLNPPEDVGVNEFDGVEGLWMVIQNWFSTLHFREFYGGRWSCIAISKYFLKKKYLFREIWCETFKLKQKYLRNKNNG